MAHKAAASPVSAYEQALHFHQRGRLTEARVLCERALTLRPRYFNALQLLGIIDLQSNQPARAAEAFGKAIQIEPASAAARHNQGNANHLLMRYEAAVASYTLAIALDPNCVASYYNCGNSLLELKRFEAAVESYDRALSIDPSHAEAWFNRGNGLLALERFASAVASLERAIAVKPGHAEAYNNRGSALCGIRDFEAAVASFDEAIAITPKHCAAHNNRGVALRDLKRHAAAIMSFNQALALEPNYADAYYNRGNSLRDLGQNEEAVASYDRAISLDARYADAYISRGEALKALGLYSAAISSFDAGIELKPNHAGLLGQRQHVRMLICDWVDFEPEVARLTARIGCNEAATSPFSLLGLSDSAALQKRAAELWMLSQHSRHAALHPIRQRETHDKIRIGYFSSDFGNHATMLLMAGLFELHDRSRYEVWAFSFGPDSTHPMRTRLEAACHVIDVASLSDDGVASLARDLEIDIAVDLKGFTRGSRPGIFAQRAAPIQVNYLGYPGTMGTSFMDYLIADRRLIPAGNEHHYSEKIIYLPGSYQVNDSKRALGIRVFTRMELGLPPSDFVFCCFNNCFKITPGMFDIWTRILRRVEGSVLWLLEDNPHASSNLRQAAEFRGVRADRLVFAPRMPLAEHLARHRAADLFLDTLPCNAHTTASDALWAGLPVLTLLGESFAGRVAASLLTAIDLPDLITSTPEEYEALAIALAADPARLAGLRERVAQNRLTTPLFDTRRFTHHIEAAFASIHTRHQAGLAPADVVVQSNHGE